MIEIVSIAFIICAILWVLYTIFEPRIDIIHNNNKYAHKTEVYLWYNTFGMGYYRDYIKILSYG